MWRVEKLERKLEASGEGQRRRPGAAATAARHIRAGISAVALAWGALQGGWSVKQRKGPRWEGLYSRRPAARH
jgi:hypothetical protein